MVSRYRAGREHERTPTWSEATPDGRWRAYDYADLVREAKVSLDLFWTTDESLTDPDRLPAPGLIAAGIVEDLEAALAQFTKVAAPLAPAAHADCAEALHTVRRTSA